MSGKPSGRPRGQRPPRVLVVDDEADLRELLELTLVGMGLDVDCAADLGQARGLLAAHAYALCLTDMRLPDGLGLELVEQIGRSHPGTPVAVLTAYGSAENAVAALKAGAFDYLSKPVALEALRSLVRTAVQVPPASSVEPIDEAADPEALVGDSPSIREVRAAIARLGRNMAPVAITGESGSGKELAARLLHRSGARAARPFVAVNCGAIPEPLMEAEFFGYRKGAFTGAEQDRDGFFQAADGGTLFLDEVADLPLPMQVKLLRAIQERRVRRVGATTEEPVDVRIVSATHQDLARCVAEGRFRQDLFYRLNVIELRMPPLRERAEDIARLAEVLLARIAARAGIERPPHFSAEALDALRGHPFPGNVRELENLLERALAFSDGGRLEVADLGFRSLPMPDGPRAGPSIAPGCMPAAAPPATTGAPNAGWAGASSETGIPASLPDYLDSVEREVILRALAETQFNRTAAAKRLGVSFRALRHRMQRLGIR
ncbi:MAG: hypothetical protein RIS35_2490 [Pseudomonadota bacterium]